MAMQIYRVGGSVRDELLGLPVKDRDWVVVGATPEQMASAGFRPVGRDFPVFLHPRTHEEYALARTERKVARGYRGFVVHADPSVTLEEDLRRRDLTINAMARGQDAVLIDPYGGRADLEAGCLRHVSEAFAEDPVRILRVARFAARFPRFSVAPATVGLMRSMVSAGEADALVAERVWQELARGLMEVAPTRMFEVLIECGALARILPALAHRWSSLPRGQLLDAAAAAGLELALRYASLTLEWPAPAAGPRSLEACCSDALKVPGDCRDLARLANLLWPQLQRWAGLRPIERLEVLEALDALRRPERARALVSWAQVVGPVLGADDALARVRHLLDDLEAARGIDAGAIARQAAQGADRAGASTAIAQAVRAARLAALARAVGPRGPAPDDLPDPLPQGLADRLGTDQGKAP
jgi:tRNA nucleotidyltransferase (CCA-adding enzyme)